MSDAFYKPVQAEVKSILLELGKPFVVQSKGTYDEATMTFGANKKRTVQGIVSDSTMVSALGVLAEDSGWNGKRVLLLDPSLNPKASDEINVDGRFFSLEKIQEVKPANVILLYILDVTL